MAFHGDLPSKTIFSLTIEGKSASIRGMGITTSQQIAKYYEQYSNTEITFTKDIIRATNLDPRQIFIKCNGGQWPCIINSTSFQTAKVVVGTKSGAYSLLSAEETPLINLRFCFNPPDSDVLMFQIPAKVAGIGAYNNSADLAVVTLTFTQRPPDDLIDIIGQLLDANQNAIRRRTERIALTEDNRRKLSIPKEETVVLIQNVPRHCILRELSFGGAKIILLGLSQFLTGKEGVLRIEFSEPAEVVSIPGIIESADAIEGRKDVCALNIVFKEDALPLSYKLHVNSFLTTVKKTQVSASDQLAMQKEQQAKLLEQQKKVAEARAANAAKNAAAQQAAEAQAAANAAARQQALAMQQQQANS